MVALRVTALLLGEEQVVALGGTTGESLPTALGADSVPPALVSAALDLHPLLVLVAVLPASLYGEGLRRSLGALTGTRERAAGWRGRIRALPVLVAAPFLLMGVLASTPLLAELRGQGIEGILLGSYVALNVGWVVVSIPISWAFRVIAPHPLPSAVALAGGFATGAFVAGFLQGFVLFLSLPIDLAAPFGGLDVIGATCAGLLWMWVLHLVLLVGYLATCSLGELRGPGAG